MIDYGNRRPPAWVDGLLLVAVIVAALVLLAACGPEPTSDVPGPAAVSAPAETSATLEPPTEPTAGCKLFIEDADRLVALEAEALTLAGEGIDALGAGDYDEADRITEEINALNEELGDAVPAYQASRDECEAGR